MMESCEGWMKHITVNRWEQRLLRADGVWIYFMGVAQLLGAAMEESWKTVGAPYPFVDQTVYLLGLNTRMIDLARD